MQFWLGLVLGLILGWIIEWIIDWWFWRGGSGGSAISSSYGADLTRITGINSDYEGRLKASGISSVASLAGSSPTAVRSAIGGSDGKSIDAEAWIVEAGGLSGSAKAGGAKTSAASGGTPNLATSLTSGGASAGSGSGSGASGSAGKGSGASAGSGSGSGASGSAGKSSGASAGSGSGKGSGSGSAGSGSGSSSPSARVGSAGIGSGSGAGKGSGASAGTGSGSGSAGSGSGSGSSSPSARAGSGSGSAGTSSSASTSSASPAKPATRSTASASPSSGASAGKGSGSGDADRKDNLTKIHGVGKVFQGKFYDAGITTWEGVSKLSDAEIRAIIQPKEWQKIETDVWIEEARILAGGGVARGGSAAAGSGRGDDLTKIHGVGKVYQGKFNDVGVYLWSEVAQLSDERILEIIEPEGWQKIDPEDWKAEARQFAAKKGGDA